MNGFLTVYKKEVRENLRDRRSLFNSVLLGPILFPILFIGLGYFAASTQQEKVEQDLEVPVVGAQYAPNLVNFLERVLLSKEKKVSEPHYLSDAVLEISDTAITAMAKEAAHLFDKANNIMASTLNIPTDEIRSNSDLTSLIKNNNRVMKTDIDDFYESQIKPLYNATVAFASKIRIDDDPEQLARLYDLRAANRYIVESTKDIKHLQKNLIRFTSSDNPAIKHEYDIIRFQLATLLRKIEQIRSEQDEDMTSLALDELKVEVERNDIIANGNLDNLIRRDLISADMATSLINDNAYARDITKNLIKMAAILFTPYEPGYKEIEDDMALIEDEIEAIVKDN